MNIDVLQIAIDLLKMSKNKGYWLMLQNCHLLLRFTRELEKLLESTGKPSDSFRLWLTTEPTPDFPIGVLQQSLKGSYNKILLRFIFYRIK